MNTLQIEIQVDDDYARMYLNGAFVIQFSLKDAETVRGAVVGFCASAGSAFIYDVFPVKR